MAMTSAETAPTTTPLIAPVDIEEVEDPVSVSVSVWVGKVGLTVAEDEGIVALNSPSLNSQVNESVAKEKGKYQRAEVHHI